eukprot:NODE_716_length_1233_cov_230.171453_g573_i0.p1 GENE.NODE_716_length_1233_cov_230.171453_g573_i0~~NODE_716_length_1233_cov_230.171453_g573_i0.p1  ORF type:complete len:377 (+),score=34.52 NODE_716_length_1233_cov_230.171453_g573_i0:25-1131(+)
MGDHPRHTSMETAVPVDYSDIEASKENILPLRQGRKADVLVHSVATPASALKKEHEVIQKRFEQELLSLDEVLALNFVLFCCCSQDTMLTVWHKYISWMQQILPTSSAKQLVPLLERATAALLSSTQAKEDERYLDIWMLYISTSADQGNLWSYVDQARIGHSFARFYRGQADYLERNGRWQEAESMYRRGVSRGAEPLTELRQWQAEFLDRKAASIEREDYEPPERPLQRLCLGDISALKDPTTGCVPFQRPCSSPKAKPAVLAHAGRQSHSSSIWVRPDGPEQPSGRTGGPLEARPVPIRSIQADSNKENTGTHCSVFDGRLGRMGGPPRAGAQNGVAAPRRRAPRLPFEIFEDGSENADPLDSEE